MENGFIIDVIMRTERLVKDQQTIFHREARFSDIEIFRNNGTTLMGKIRALGAWGWKEEWTKKVETRILLRGYEKKNAEMNERESCEQKSHRFYSNEIFLLFSFFVLFTSGKHEEVINHKEMKWLAVWRKVTQRDRRRTRRGEKLVKAQWSRSEAIGHKRFFYKGWMVCTVQTISRLRFL